MFHVLEPRWRAMRLVDSPTLKAKTVGNLAKDSRVQFVYLYFYFYFLVDLQRLGNSLHQFFQKKKEKKSNDQI